jgi:hypothetical protein
MSATLRSAHLTPHGIETTLIPDRESDLTVAILDRYGDQGDRHEQ